MERNCEIMLDASIATPAEIETRAKIFAALADPTRLRAIELLSETHELSCSDIANRLGISLALFSHHYKTLAEAGLILTRKEGQTKYNSLNRDLLMRCFDSFKSPAEKA
ncbi:MAG: winged helix-turn-helix transcriptional regulator [Leptolyngbyaceae cyanobacterium SM1_3_5]|nr:winged helix-turn-helix transcriptional regulator [Leptolyngbyaceae cyanobacterium SM1_3_5]